jgi:NAD(P)-dependent dehydrogenase (short-subunit alcohol dehydrogenase family)
MSPRSILITGCSSGIGEACALGLHTRGWRVFATARKSSDINRLDAAGLEALYLDYNDPASIVSCVAEVLNRTDGRIDALFNNGMHAQLGAVEDLTTDVLRAQFEAGLFGWHDLTRQLIPSMRSAGTGRIVQCSSVLGLVSLKYRGAYSAAKFALEALTDALRQELHGTGIYVSLIEPGPVRTGIALQALGDFRLHIDIENSAHCEVYRRRIASLEQNRTRRLVIEPNAVVKKLVHAVESARPRPRYPVALYAHVMAMAKRALSTRMLDTLLRGQ